MDNKQSNHLVGKAVKLINNKFIVLEDASLIAESGRFMISLHGNYSTREVWLNGELLSPKESQKIINHSPDGFSWGYGGSGPAQLALAILLKITSRETAMQMYQDFKWDVIASLPQSDIDVLIDVGKYQ